MDFAALKGARPIVKVVGVVTSLRYSNFGATPSQNLAVKEFCFVPREKCGGFFVKFLAATFPGN